MTDRVMKLIAGNAALTRLDVVQVHLEHRLVRRLLSRFLSQGFQSRLSRVSVKRPLSV